MNLQNVSFIALLTVVSLVFLGLMADFLQPIFWAATLAVIFHPVFVRLLIMFRQRRSIAAMLTLLVICLTVLLPAWFVASSVINEASLLYMRIQSGEIEPGEALVWLQSTLPPVNAFLERIGITPEQLSQNLSAAAMKASQFIGTAAIKTGQNAVRFSVMFILMLYVLFFFPSRRRRSPRCNSSRFTTGR